MTARRAAAAALLPLALVSGLVAGAVGPGPATVTPSVTVGRPAAVVLAAAEFAPVQGPDGGTSGSGSSGSGSSGSSGGGSDGSGSGSGGSGGSGSSGSGSGSGGSDGSGSGSGGGGSGGSGSGGSGSSGGGSGGGSSGSGSSGSSGSGPTVDPRPPAEPPAAPSPEPVRAQPVPPPGPDPRAVREAELARQRAAEKAAAQLAAARQRATEAWASRGRPDRLLLIKSATIDVVSGGRLVNQIRRTSPVSTMFSLDRVVPDGWVRNEPEASTLAAMVVLSPGVTLDLSGPRVVRLAGGSGPAQAAAIFTGSGRIVARNVTVTSVDPATGRPMPPAAGRPFVAVARAGRLEATDTTFSDLGTSPDDPERHSGVQFNEGSSGSLVRTTLSRNTTGLRLSGSNGVRLDGLTVTEAQGDGLVLQRDTGTVLRGIRAERNGGNGVLVQGDATDRVISEIATTGNRAFGLVVAGQVRPRITGVTTVADRSGGLRLNHVSQAVVSDFVAQDQSIGVFTHVGSTGLVFERMRISGGRRGLVIEKSTSGLAVRDSVIEGTNSVGVSLGGKDTTLERLTVTGSRTAVRAERGSSGVRATGLTVSGGDDGFVANPGSAGVVLRDLTASGIGNDAVRTYSPDTRIDGARITGADTGIVTSAAASVHDTEITEVHTGLRSRGGVPVAAERVAVAALTVGVDAAPGSPVRLTSSRVHALQALRGEVLLNGPNDLSLPPLNLLGAIGVPLIILALLLELVHTVRQRKFRPGGRRTPPRPRPLLVPAGA